MTCYGVSSTDATMTGVLKFTGGKERLIKYNVELIHCLWQRAMLRHRRTREKHYRCGNIEYFRLYIEYCQSYMSYFL